VRDQYHAFSKAMYKIYRKLEKPVPELIDYVVVIPRAGNQRLRADGNHLEVRGQGV